MSVTLILDNTILSFNGGVWTQTPPGLWYNGSALFSSKATSTSTDFLHVINFVGTSISWIGVPPSADNSTSFFVNIDNAADNSTATFPDNQVGSTWWTSPPLTDVVSGHTLYLYNLEQTILDYMLVTAGTQTNFDGKTIFVDDINSEITWLGQWLTTTDYTITTGAYDVMPAGNGTHTSTTVGDSFSFTFAGTSINVYGVMSFGSSGSINAIFSLDGESAAPRSFTANENAVNGLINATNYQLFSATALSAGEHTLRVNVTGVTGNLPFIIDYITYVPSFFNLASKPDFSGQPGIGSSNSNSSGSSNSSSTGSSGGSGSSNDTSASGSSKTPTGAIAGGVIGGLVVIAVIIGAILIFRRRRTKQSDYLEPTPYIPSNDKLVTEPFHDPNASLLRQMESDASIKHTNSNTARAFSSKDSRGDETSWSGAMSRMTAADKQAELRRRVEEINALMQQIDGGGGSGQSSSSAAGTYIPNRNELQERIDMLTRENEMLMASVPPPLYEENSPDSSNAVSARVAPERKRSVLSIVN